MSRKRLPNLTERLASVLLDNLSLRQRIAELEGRAGDGELDMATAQKMTASQICSLFSPDHGVLHADGGDTHPTNITMRLVPAHWEKTRKRDIPTHAKNKNIRKGVAAHRDVLARKVGLVPVDVRGARADGLEHQVDLEEIIAAAPPKRKAKKAWPKRSFPKRAKTTWPKRSFAPSRQVDRRG